MDDSEQVKLYIFTVQALLRPESTVGRKTHKFQEGLGEAFYAHLQGLDDLLVFADEHHTWRSYRHRGVFKTSAGATTNEPRPLRRLKKGVGYQGYKKSLYTQDWFDSSPEREVANAVDDELTIDLWVRLQTGDLPILWSGAREYNPDFIAVDRDGIHWVVEVKMDKEMETADVQGKRDAAKRRANHVSADAQAGTIWRYVLI